MRFTAVVATLAVVFGISGLAVHYGDRELLVGPPEAAVDGFVRKVVLERYEEAKTHLSEDAAMSENELRRLRRTLTRKVGSSPSDYETEVESMDRAKARVKVTLRWRERSESFVFDLGFDSGWKIERTKPGGL